MSPDTTTLYTFEFDFEDPCVYGVDVVRALLAHDTGVIRDLDYQIGMDATDLVLTANAESANKAALYAHEFAELVAAETPYTVTNTRYTGAYHLPGRSVGREDGHVPPVLYDDTYIAYFSTPIEPVSARAQGTGGAIGADDIEVIGNRATLTWVHSHKGSSYAREAAFAARKIAAAMGSEVVSVEHGSTRLHDRESETGVYAERFFKLDVLLPASMYGLDVASHLMTKDHEDLWDFINYHGCTLGVQTASTLIAVAPTHLIGELVRLVNEALDGIDVARGTPVSVAAKVDGQVSWWAELDVESARGSSTH